MANPLLPRAMFSRSPCAMPSMEVRDELSEEVGLGRSALSAFGVRGAPGGGLLPEARSDSTLREPELVDRQVQADRPDPRLRRHDALLADEPAVPAHARRLGQDAGGMVVREQRL